MMAAGPRYREWSPAPGLRRHPRPRGGGPGLARRESHGGPAGAAAVARLRATEAPSPVAALAADLGASERQLNRRCLAALGYGPKTLHRILRLRRFLALARASAATLAAVAADAGYADQAHLARDCQSLAGLPPSRLLGFVPTAG